MASYSTESSQAAQTGSDMIGNLVPDDDPLTLIAISHALNGVWAAVCCSSVTL